MADERGGGANVALIVARQPAVVADPAQCAFNDPSFGQDDEAVLVAAAHDLQLPRPGALYRRQHPWSLVAGIADHALDEGKQASHLGQQRFRPVTILHVGRADQHPEQ